jgi:secreted PhoX family phosphatase
MSNMMKFSAGYLFKPDHVEIHFVKKSATGDMRRSYRHNFTTDQREAMIGKDEARAKQAIEKLVAKFKADDEYTWTPVVIDVEQNTYQRLIYGKWVNESIALKSQITQ